MQKKFKTKDSFVYKENEEDGLMGKDKKETKVRVKRMPTFAEAIIPIIAMLVILTVGKGVMGFSTEPLLILVACVAAFVAWRVGVTWD